MGGLIEDAKALADETPSGWLDPNLEPTPTVAAARKAYEERYGVSAVVDRAGVQKQQVEEEQRFLNSLAKGPKTIPDDISAQGKDRVLADFEKLSERLAREYNAVVENLLGPENPSGLPRLIGVCGRFSSGKDTLGAHLVANYGYTRFAFADKLKYLAHLVGWNGEKDEAGRALLQTLGIGAREILGEDVWIRAVDRQIYPSDGPSPSQVVITDVRLPNEAEWIRSNGGQVWKVIRKGAALSTPASNHVSETSVDEIRPDVIVPNVGSIEDLHWVVDEILKGGK
jgi:hypothetical protein